MRHRPLSGRGGPLRRGGRGTYGPPNGGSVPRRRRPADRQAGGSAPSVGVGAVLGIEAFYDPAEEVPEYWFREPVSYYGTRAEQDAQYRSLSAWRRQRDARRKAAESRRPGAYGSQW